MGLTSAQDVISTSQLCSTATSTSVAVVIPCYNEIGVLHSCVDEVLSLAGVDKVVVVDDGSNDGSAEMCKNLARRYAPRLEAVLLPHNIGKNAALRKAITTISSTVIVVFDTDLTVSSDDLERMIGVVRTHPRSYAYGSRFRFAMPPGAMSMNHVAGNRFFAWWVSRLLDRTITDVLCGLKAMPREVMIGVPQSHCRWGDLDLFFGAADALLPFREFPVVYRPRQAGRSKMKALSSAVVLASLCLERTARAVGKWRRFPHDR